MVRYIDFALLNKSYSTFLNSNFLDRYINYEDFEDYFVTELSAFYNYDSIGLSELGKSILSVDVGRGKKKIFIWSQMHGNESTTTKSILDFLNYIRYNTSNSFVSYLLQTCTIKIIPILNPDGASLYTRLNANGIDLNRDASKRTQKETQFFFQCLRDFNPDYCFNMHGQRTIFSAGGMNNPATLSFLAPSYDYGLSINESRAKAMKLIIAANDMLSEFIPNQVGKYDDAHNPNCFGDLIQKKGIPTVLFEAGHYKDDYSRNIVRRFVMLSLLKMIESIVYSDIDHYNIDHYKNIPQNKELFLDIIIKNASNSTTGYVGIQYNEVLEKDKISFKPYVKSLNDLSDFYAHRYIDANNEPITVNRKSTLYTDLNIEELMIGDKDIDLKL